MKIVMTVTQLKQNNFMKDRDHLAATTHSSSGRGLPSPN